MVDRTRAVNPCRRLQMPTRFEFVTVPLWPPIRVTMASSHLAFTWANILGCYGAQRSLLRKGQASCTAPSGTYKRLPQH